MGQVIEIKEQKRPRIGGLVEDFIEEAYLRLSMLQGFKERPGQKELSIAVKDALVLGMPLAAEAPTGTGKTIAYLVGALAAAEALRKTKNVPVVIATATVGLQNQIMQGDLPRLIGAGVLNEGAGVVAKGRGRYFCPFSAERLLEEDEGPQSSLFDIAANARGASVDEIKKINALWNSGGWAGDLDSLPLKPPELWDTVKASSQTCVGNKCEHFNDCPFMASRRALSVAQVIIANHDLVLADLEMSAQGLDPVLPVSYLAVFDEAHHLPDKAVQVGAGAVRIAPMLEKTAVLAGFKKAWSTEIEFLRILEKSGVGLEDFEGTALASSLEKLQTVLLGVKPEEGEVLRFPRGEVPSTIRQALQACLAPTEAILSALKDSSSALRGSNVLAKKPELSQGVIGLLGLSASVQSAISDLHKGLVKALSSDFLVRWVAYPGDSAEVCSSPLEGADVLTPLVWNSERLSAVLVSATLQDADGFGAFQKRVGLPDMLTLELKPIFDYSRSQLGVVSTKTSPSYDNRVDFEKEVCSLLPSFISASEATLVLFPSRRFLTMALPALREKFGPSVLAQGDRGTKELLRAHKTRVTSGLGSVLCGLATMAEGLDLPGELCTHVVICALPFSAPSGPIEMEMKDILGDKYFGQKALPETFVKLVQMVGRLIRRESDVGKITIFDRRLTFTRWGQKLLNALPPFTKRQIAPQDGQKWLEGASAVPIRGFFDTNAVAEKPSQTLLRGPSAR